ncbi:MAG: hypothetical protein QOG52_2299, partial [Frankiaceae bacterium]|nr:hypothetical protein [Frankiaceae bacterium]
PRTSDRSLYAPLSSTLRSFFADQHVAAPRGRYTVTLRCRAKLDVTSLEDFTATIAVDSHGRYAALGDAARVFPKPDDGDALGSAGSAGFTPSGEQLAGALPAVADSAHRSSYTWQLLVALVALVGGLVVVRRMSPRPGTRPDASTNLRKVGQ